MLILAAAIAAVASGPSLKPAAPADNPLRLSCVGDEKMVRYVPPAPASKGDPLFRLVGVADGTALKPPPAFDGCRVINAATLAPAPVK